VTDHDDAELARRLRDHYRSTEPEAVPAALEAEVREMLSSPTRRRVPGGPIAAVAAVLVVAVVGTAVALNQRGASSSDPSAPASQHVAGASPTPTMSQIPSISPTASPAPQFGVVPVHRGSAIPVAVAAATDESPFLVGGQLAYVIADCSVRKDFPRTPLLEPCGGGLLIGSGDASGTPLVNDGEHTGLAGPDGELVIRVHTHDERAADCPPNYRLACERAVVVEQVVQRSLAGGGPPAPAFSVLPPQLPTADCQSLSFEATRCAAVVERARATRTIAWPNVASVRIERPAAVSLGSEGVAIVVFELRQGTDQRVDVRCRLLRGPSLVCGPLTIEAVPPSP
jgi:hypothetical protein